MVENNPGIADLERKARIMNVVHWLGGPRMPRVEPITAITRGVFQLHVRDIQVTDRAYLDEALNRASKDKQRLMFTLRHRADADALAFRAGLERIGQKEVADRIVWVAGVNMLKRPHILPFSFCEEVVYIATPEDLELASQLQDMPELNPLEVRRLRWINSAFHRINNAAKKAVRKVIEKGRHLVIYPEAGRSKDGYLRRAPRQVSVYFPRNGSALVVPVVINGTEQINPPGKNWTLERIHPDNRRSIELVFGEAYSSLEPWEVARKMRSSDVTPADWVMANIANVDPRGVKEEELRLYREMIMMYRPERNEIPEDL